jgi:hypothetical protein
MPIPPAAAYAAAAHNVTAVPIKSRLPTSTPQLRKIS